MKAKAQIICPKPVANMKVNIVQVCSVCACVIRSQPIHCVYIRYGFTYDKDKNNICSNILHINNQYQLSTYKIRLENKAMHNTL